MPDVAYIGPGGRDGRRRPLLRTLVGDVLRRNRLQQRRTLADVAQDARVSMPYLSEIERGRKEASSEVLSAVCAALRMELADLVAAVGHDLAKQRTPARTAALSPSLSPGRHVIAPSPDGDAVSPVLSPDRTGVAPSPDGDAVPPVLSPDRAAVADQEVTASVESVTGEGGRLIDRAPVVSLDLARRLRAHAAPARSGDAVLLAA